MKLVQLSKKEKIDWDKMIEEKAESMLKLLLVDDKSFHDIQRNILAALESSKALDTLDIPFTTLVSLITGREDFRSVFVQMVTNLVRRPEELGEQALGKIAGYLCDIVKGCDREVSNQVLGGIEANIEVAFYRDELLNMLVSRLS